MLLSTWIWRSNSYSWKKKTCKYAWHSAASLWVVVDVKYQFCTISKGIWLWFLPEISVSRFRLSCSSQKCIMLLKSCTHLWQQFFVKPFLKWITTIEGFYSWIENHFWLGIDLCITQSREELSKGKIQKHNIVLLLSDAGDIADLV